MKTKFLEELGLDKDVIAKIMAENGKDIQTEKDKAKGFEDSLKEVQEKLKGFEGIDVAELQKQVKTLTTDLSAKDQEYQKKISEIEFSRTLETAVTSAKAKSSKAVMALLDVDKLKESKNQQTDIVAALEAVKKEHTYLFETVGKPTGPTAGPQAPPAKEGETAAANMALRAALGKGD